MQTKEDARLALSLTKDFSRDPQEYYFQRYQDFLATGEYPYDKNVVDFIAKDYAENPLTAQELNMLGFERYQCSDRQKKLDVSNILKTLIANGYKPLTLDEFDNAYKNKQRLIVRHSGQGAFCDYEKEGNYRTHVDYTGKRFLIAPRCRRRGIYLDTLLSPVKSNWVMCKAESEGK